MELLHGEYAVEEGPEKAKSEPILVKHNIKTYLISPKYDSIVENEAINQVLISSLPCPQVNSIFIITISQLKIIFSQFKLDQNLNRKNFMQNSMEQFRDIMTQTNIEMERELERMPIGRFP